MRSERERILKAESYKVDRCSQCGSGVMHPDRIATVRVEP